MRLQVFLEEHHPTTIDQLRELLSYRRERGYGAFWLHDAGRSLGLFIAADKACMYFGSEREGEGNRWSYNPNYDGSVVATTEFRLENGEPAQIPMESIISVENAIRAFEEFFAHSTLSADIEWC